MPPTRRSSRRPTATRAVASATPPLSSPVRVKPEQWYLVRGVLANGDASRPRPAVVAEFLAHGEPLRRQAVELHRARPADEALLGWVQAPDEAAALRIELPDGLRPEAFAELTVHEVAERDPKCHPLAAVPAWSSVRPGLKLERIVLPESLAALTPLAAHLPTDVVKRPKSKAALARLVHEAIVVLDPAWLRPLDVRLGDLLSLAREGWLIVDLESFADVVRKARVAETEVRTLAATREIMSARVEYADVPTRGFALQDVLPYGYIDADGDFATRALLATKSWKALADESGFAPLLITETPWARKCHDVLSAASAVGRGELIVTDLPWLQAGAFGPLIAPRLMAHLLRMHLAGPIDDGVQYWNRWDDTKIVVRDISELPRRFPPLEAVRWASSTPGCATLGIALPPAEAERGPWPHLLIRTGRIDTLAPHDAMPPEPMMLLMKTLARWRVERAGKLPAALARLGLVWQFDSAAGLKYAVGFRSAGELFAPQPERALEIRVEDGDPRGGARGDVLGMNVDVGLFGDGALAVVRRLLREVPAWIDGKG